MTNLKKTTRSKPQNERIKIKYRDLEKEIPPDLGVPVWGYSAGRGTIHVDISLKGKKKLEIILHECIHEIFRDMSEEEVVRASVILTRTLWHERYRQIDDDETLKLQDGK